MKTPPFLLGATLAFWGWQTGFLVPGVVMGLALELARLVKARWDLSDDDFARIWTFCSLALLAAVVYSFTANEGPADLKGLFQNPSLLNQHNAGVAAGRTTSSVLRWLPMTFFLFIFAQAYSSREAIPLHVISLILQYRWKAARKKGLPVPLSRNFNVSYPYFALCLFSASIHAGDDTTFFWGFCLLTGWALWPERSPRFALALWVVVLSIVIALSYFGQHGIGQFQTYLGNLNPQWLGGFARRRFDPTQSQTEIGTLGRIKTSTKIVIRLEAPDGVPPRRLREASYRGFKGRTWYAELTENDFNLVGATNETTFTLVDKPTLETVKIACYLPGGKALLPLPEGVGRLDNLLAYNVWKCPLGAVLEEGPGLVVFDARYGLGNTLDSPADDQDTSIPEREKPALDQIVSDLHLHGQSVNEALKTLAQFFSTQFTYSTWQDRDRTPHRNESPLTRFMLHSRSGHCEYFATAAVLLLRSIDIPARYAVGYAVHEGSDQNYIVRQRDAHAWCLVWDATHHSWRDFDPTPASWVAVESSRISWAQRVSDLWARVTFELSKFRWGQSHVRQYVLWTVIPILALLLYQILFRTKHQRRSRNQGRLGQLSDWPGLDSEFYELERQLSARGLGRNQSEPLREWLARVAKDKNLGSAGEGLRELLLLHYRYRFDPEGLTPAERDELRAQACACRVVLERVPAQLAERH
ncbi:MAG TPA: transglutaminase-like domain-containing protein [Verrucomicrobiae bacterium]|nr:transglutaminase-like domain-containing protein [Verrucomicrobiae bacterium]